MKMRLGLVAVAIVAIAGAERASAQALDRAAVARVAAQLEVEIERAMLEGEIPSLTVALVDADSELWSSAFGVSNRWARTPATTQTVYLIGSTFKAQSTIALLQQMEKWQLDLDDPVNEQLDGVVIRGEDPDRPVTYRHLLTHTSGMPVDFGPHLVWGDTAPLPLGEYIADSLRVETPPETAVVYSNMAYSVVGWLVEKLGRMPYKQYIHESVWGPLGMDDTTFDLRPDQEERLAVPYAPDENGNLVPAPRLKANVWPAGIVYGTIHDQAKWVSFNLGDGVASDVTVAFPAQLEEMQTLQFEEFSGQPMGGGWGYEDPGYGLTWWTTHRDAEQFFAHSGSVPGYTAFVMGNRGRRLGIAFLTNGNAAHPYLARLSNLALDLMSAEQDEIR